MCSISPQVKLRTIGPNDEARAHNACSQFFSLTVARFRWVTCQLDYLCGFSSDFERRSALGQLPPSLHETYLRLLQRFRALPSSTQSKVQMCLHFIAFSPVRLPINSLLAAISTPEVIGARLDADNMVSEAEIASKCGSLLRKTDDGDFFEFAHFSVREFLEHEYLAGIPDLKMYRISRERSNEMLAEQSLRFLQLSNFDAEFTDSESLTDYILDSANKLQQPVIGFHCHAVRLSVVLSKHVQSDSTSISLTKSLFQPQKSSCFLLFTTSLCFDLTYYLIRIGLIQCKGVEPYRELAQKLLLDDFRPLHLAAALNLPDVCLHLIDAGSNLNAGSSLGSPFELCCESFLRIVLDDCNPALIEKHNHHLHGPICAFLGNNNQRNATFEIFEDRNFEQLGPDSTGQTLDDTAVLRALIIAFAGNNFWVVQKLLSRGMTLEDTIYTRILPDLMSKSISDIQSNETPLLSFLQDIGSRLGAESGWPLEIGRVIWNTAVELELLFTRDPTLTDSRISLSKDALVSRSFATIKSNDMGGLQECLADGRLDLSERHRNPLASQDQVDQQHLTLLHFAVLEENLRAVQLLAQAGCDPNIPSIQIQDRLLPVHECFHIDIFEELFVCGASVADVDAYRGQNIWHFYGSTYEPRTDFFDYVARRFPSGTADALLTKSKDGHTPLQLLLISKDLNLAREDHVERAMALIATCERVVDFWSRHDSILGVAAEFGSEKVILRLIEIGAGSETVDPDLETPLHRISTESSSASVQYLKKVFPEAVHARFEGRLPLQAYLQKCLHGNDPIDDLVVQQLCTAEAVESIDGRGTSLWEYYCSFNVPNRNPSKPSSNVMLWTWLLGKTSAMQVYEKGSGKSGLILILSRLITLDQVEDLTSAIPPHVLNQAIDSTDRWETDKLDASLLRFLQFTIKNRAYSLVELLVERGVSIHGQVDGYSSFQIAFQSPLVVSLCSDEAGKHMLLAMLDHATLEHLNGHDRDDLTILHTLATKDSDGDHGLEWLVRTLVLKGVDIDRMAIQGRCTPMAYHIWKGSVSCATHLLELGADPGVSEQNYPNAVLEASYRGSTTFLRKVLDQSEKSGMTIDWKRKAVMQLKSRNGSVLQLVGVSAIHYASTNRLEVLKWYNDNGLIDNLGMTSAAGWTAMHCAAFCGQAAIIEYLVSRGCETMPKTEGKLTPLHLSVVEGHYESTRTLIRLGAKDVPDIRGARPTTIASRSKDESIIQLLRGLSASETSFVDEPARNSLRRQELKGLAMALKEAILSDNIKECKRLCELGCPVNISIGGWSPLGLALAYSHLDIAQWLLDSGAETTARMRAKKDPIGPNAMEICLRRPELCKLIPKLAEQCIHDGSGWPLLANRSFLGAVGTANTEGLSTLLKFLNERALHIRYRNSHCLA